MSANLSVSDPGREDGATVSVPNRPVLIIDADNTLWDTDEVFARAQLRVLELTERHIGRVYPGQDRLEFVRKYDQAIAARHHLHLKYPAQLLIGAVGAGLLGSPAESAAESVIRGRPFGHSLSESQLDEVLAEYTQALSDMPDLLPTVREALHLAKIYELIVVVMTEGKIERQRQLLDQHGLADLVSNVWEMSKTIDQFGRLRKRFAPADVVVIGDQTDRDIAPSHSAGCKTVLVPGRFKPFWLDRSGQVADHIATNLLGAVQWVIDCSSLSTS